MEMGQVLNELAGDAAPFLLTTKGFFARPCPGERDLALYLFHNKEGSPKNISCQLVPEHPWGKDGRVL
jgi:hypothetical protein